MPKGVYEHRKGTSSWSKGLTKETDARIKAISDGMQGNKNGVGHTCVPWNKGFTKEIDARIDKQSKSLSLFAVMNRGRLGRKVGFQQTQKTKDKCREAAKKQWSNREIRELMLSKVLKANAVRPNKAEVELGDILGKDFRYTGDGSFFIGGKVPDFVNVNGKKQVVELLGCYWHGCPKHYPNEEKQREFEDRVQLFKSFGYATLGVWEHELSNPEVVKQKIFTF